MVHVRVCADSPLLQPGSFQQMGLLGLRIRILCWPISGFLGGTHIQEALVKVINMQSNSECLGQHDDGSDPHACQLTRA